MLPYCSSIIQSKSKLDTSAVEARNGKDIQGIPWERLNFTRDKYRETRLKQYKNYENLSISRDNLEKVFLLPFFRPMHWSVWYIFLVILAKLNFKSFFFTILGVQGSRKRTKLLRLSVQYKARQINYCALSGT